MKIAVFSDVHGNLEALKKVLRQISEKNADLTVFLGDIFQRGNEEFECLELLKNSGVICLKGNCELYAEHGVDIDPRCGASEGLLRQYKEEAHRGADAVHKTDAAVL